MTDVLTQAEIRALLDADRWAHLSLETRLAFALQEIGILQAHIGEIIDHYKNLPECMREAACVGLLGWRSRGSALQDPRDREIANLKSELAATRRTLAKASARLVELEDGLILVLGGSLSLGAVGQSPSAPLAGGGAPRTPGVDTAEGRDSQRGKSNG